MTGYITTLIIRTNISRRPKNRTKHRGIVFMVFMALAWLLTTPIFGQHTKGNLPVQLELRLQVQRVCVNEPVTAWALVKNISEKSVVIVPEQIGYMSSFLWVGNQGEGTAGTAYHSVAHSWKGDKPEFVILNPGETFTRKLRFPLEKTYFKAGRNYSIQVAYGQFKPRLFEGQTVWVGGVESNEVEFKTDTRCSDTVKK